MKHVTQIIPHGTLAIACVFLGASALRGADPSSVKSAVVSPALAKLHQEAAAVRPLVKSRVARDFLAAVEHLTPPSPRNLYRDEARQFHCESAASKLTAPEREKLEEVPFTDLLYYYTKYGTPLAYARPLELLGESSIKTVRGKRILDYGYGTIGHLRLLAACGADAVGVDVDSFLRALYSRPDDQGKLRIDGKSVGSVTLVDGRWPGDRAARESVDAGYDLILSKNTLKNGYLHPEREVDPRMLVDLGVSEEVFVRVLYASLKPGGLVMIYNLSPAPAPPDQPYKPWADGRCPFPRAMLSEVGFEILAYDQEDSAAARTMARAFGWDNGQGGMDLENDLFAHYTLLRRSK